MPRDLWQLEGQQLRLILMHIQDAQRAVAQNTSFRHRTAAPSLERAEQIIEEILADGPHSRDESD
jgi:hypothetical protein